MKKSKTIIALTLGITTTMCGCSAVNENNSSTTKEPTIPSFQAKEQFLIGNWGVPPHANTGYLEYANNPDYCNVQEWTKMHDCGFNVAVPTEGTSLEEIKRDLDMASQVGMKILVRDRTSSGLESLINTAFARNYNYKQTREELDKKASELKEHIDAFIKYDSFMGVNAYDEPSMDYYEIISACQDWFLINYPNYKFYVNLLPVYAAPKQLYGSRASEALTYTDYVASFAKIVNPYCLSYDHYPILADYDGTPYIKEDFLYNLNEFATQAKKNKVPAYIYIQTMGFFNNLPLSSYEDFAWQVYSSLAFGMKGILCFQYWTQLQAEYHNNVRQGIVERDGTINPIYYEVQKVFNDIKSMEDIYMSYTWNGIKTYEGGRIVNDMFTMVNNQLDSLNDINNVDTDNDIIIGQFTKNESTNEYAYMVMNATSPFVKEKANVKLQLPGYDYCYIVKNSTKELVKLENQTLNLQINSSEGTFVIPLK